MRHIEMARDILDSSTDPAAVAEAGQPTVDTALRNSRDSTMARLLTERGIEIPLWLAASMWDIELMKKAMEAGFTTCQTTRC